MPVVNVEIETTDRSEAMRVVSELTSASTLRMQTIDRLSETGSGFKIILLVESGFSSHEEEQ